jgi:hypothetical protein
MSMLWAGLLPQHRPIGSLPPLTLLLTLFIRLVRHGLGATVGIRSPKGAMECAALA